MHERKIIYVFIDSQNLNLGIQDAGWRLDFGRFRVYLKDKYFAETAFLFIGYIAAHQKLYNFLQQCGYTLVFKPTLELGGVVKGNVDAELVLHTMIEYPNYDKAIIVSGDGDFYCLAEYLLKQNKLEKILIPNKRKRSQLLMQFKEHLEYMNNLKEKLGRKL